MTTTEIDKIIERANRQTQSTQATAIEQSRAIAEVQAAVVVAQQVPRDMGAAWADMEAACTRPGLANRAFYQVTNRGSGPTVHLARELARIFGNMQHGVHELRRDDELGMSEIQAFAWDVEKNSRTTRTFQVPHARMKGGQRQPLTDLTDVYLNNQNIGARAMRECIFAVLPADFVDAAQDLCHRTLVNGAGKPLPDRIADMVRVFAEVGVTVDQLEERIGRKRSAWQPIDIAQMTIVYQSMQRGEIIKEDAFPVKRITAAEVLSDDQQPSHQVPKQEAHGVIGAGAPATPQEASPRGGQGEATTGPGDDPANSPGPASPGPSVEDQQAEIRRLSEERRNLQAADRRPVETKGGAGNGEADEPEVSTGRATGPKITVPQQAEISRHFARLDVLDSQERMWWVGRFAGLEDNMIKAVKDLRQAEAVKVIASLERLKDRDQLDALLNGQDELLPPE